MGKESWLETKDRAPFRWVELEVMVSCPHRNISGQMGHYSNMKRGIECPREARAEGIPAEGRGEAMRKMRITDSQAHCQHKGARVPPPPCQVLYSGHPKQLDC